MPNMDPRSLNFLKKHNIKNIIHTPKRINKRILEYFDIFIAVDFFVLMELNRLYPRYKKKFKLSTSQFKKIDIIDPYKLNDMQYESVMNDIHKVSKDIDLEII